MLAFTLTGCEIYFGKSGGDDSPGGDAQPGWACGDNNECAAGCYCEGATAGKQGECVEAGFCDSDADCGPGLVCDDRSSCVPGDPPKTCETKYDCDAGSVCNNGVCEATCVCENDAQAQAAGFHHCDEQRKTCEEGQAGTCAGEPTCGTEPQCPQGGVGEIGADGCWTGLCVAIVTCDITPSCNNYQHEADCFDPANGQCSATYTGLNCKKPDGTACQSGDAGCTCESFVFATCRPSNAN
jgi:hypothetical protein